jgi:hypothetical protein
MVNDVSKVERALMLCIHGDFKNCLIFPLRVEYAVWRELIGGQQSCGDRVLSDVIHDDHVKITGRGWMA